MDHGHVNLEVPLKSYAQHQPESDNLDEYEFLNQGLIKSRFFEDGSSFIMTVLSWVLDIITLGLFTPLLVNIYTRRAVERMVIGNRHLVYAPGDNLKIAMWSVVDRWLNFLTLGLWYLLGYSHKYYLSQFDERISWGEPAACVRVDGFRDSIVWEPVGDGKGTFKIYSAYLGFGNELVRWALSLVDVLFLGFITPFRMKFYFTQYLEKVELGQGRFAVIHPRMAESIDNHAKNKKISIQVPDQPYSTKYPVSGFPAKANHRVYDLKLKFEAELGDLYKFFIVYNLLVYLTLFLFPLFVPGYMRNYLNKKVRVYVESSSRY